MIGCDWTVGMEVVCIVDIHQWYCCNYSDAPTLVWPEKGRIYKITEIELDEEEGLIFIGLEGYPANAVMDARAFRPVEKRKTDISLFKAMLEPKSKPVIAPAREPA